MNSNLLHLLLYFPFLFPLLNRVLTWEIERVPPDIKWDPRGYVFYCPCMGFFPNCTSCFITEMLTFSETYILLAFEQLGPELVQNIMVMEGRFGNQAEHFLGAIAFAKALDRTLILPPWRTYKNIPFSDFFQVEPLRSYHQVILAEDFMKHLAPSHWPKGKRHGYCWLPPGSGAQCRMKDGNPFKPFWDELGVDFDEKIVYHLGTRVQDPYERDKWKKEFPPSNHPVLAFRGAPASFPVEEQNRQVHAFLKWSDKINEEVDEYIKSTLPPGPFVGIHLRNGIDWRNACEHADGIPQFMASPQCLGYSQYRTVTRDLCFPPKQDILNRTEQAVRNHGVKSVFVATDNDPMLEELNFKLKGMNVQVFHLNPWLPQLDLAILGRADHFIGNCVSSFSSFVKRERDFNGKPSSFFAFDD